MIKVLVIDSDTNITTFLTRGLALQNIRVLEAQTVDKGFDKFLHHYPNMVLLGDNLPNLPTLEIISRLGAADKQTPIIILGHEQMPPEKYVTLLDAGADHVVSKPVDVPCIAAIIRAILRRLTPPAPAILRFGNTHPLELDTGTRILKRGGNSFELTAKEYDLLELFLRHPRQVLTRDIIYEKVWEYDFNGESNVIEVYVRYLRKKIEKGGHGRLIHTVRSVGYVLKEEVQAA